MIARQAAQNYADETLDLIIMTLYIHIYIYIYIYISQNSAGASDNQF